MKSTCGNEQHEIVITESGSDEDSAELRAAVHEFNVAATGYRDARGFSCYLRDHDGKLVAGIDGYTWGGYARIEYLWVHEALRGRGIGTQLVAAAEHEARGRGCVKVILDSHSFQAPAFYTLLGYREVATTSDTPVGYTDTLFEKALH